MPYVPAVLADLPAGGSFYKFDEASGTLVDSGSGGNNSLTTPGINYRQAGPLNDGTTNYSLGFNGTTSTITFGDIFNFAGVGLSTIEFWMLAAAGNSSTYILDNLDSGVGNNGWRVQFDSTADTIFYDRRAGGLQDRINYAPVTGWRHVALPYDGSNQRIYVDGALVAGPTASANSLPTPGTGFTVGSFEGTGGFFIGNLAFLALYPGVALSGTTISTHFQQASIPASTGLALRNDANRPFGPF